MRVWQLWYVFFVVFLTACSLLPLNTEDDPEAGEFMVQCEDCKVWQHGPCMGYQTEAQIPEDDYYCEQCRPDMHIELLKYAPFLF